MQPSDNAEQASHIADGLARWHQAALMGESRQTTCRF